MEEMLSAAKYEARELLPFINHNENPDDDLVFKEAAVDFMINYKDLRMRYVCAMKEIRTKFEVLSTEFGVRYERNPISNISTRLKRSSSIVAKMKKLGLDPTLENMEKNISDIAGVRVICSYIDDIYMLAEALKSQKDITLIAEKDYISKPKENGYRSLHLIVSVPVFFADQMKNMTVEVQIRTIAMDFWASLEHELKYKKEVSNSDVIAARLKECADVIAKTDAEMQNIRKELEKNAAPLSDAEMLLNKLKNLDSPI